MGCFCSAWPWEGIRCCWTDSSSALVASLWGTREQPHRSISSQLPAVLVRRWVESMNDLLLPAGFSAVSTSCSSLNCCSQPGLKCPDRWSNPALAYGTGVWACMTLIFPCLLCNTFSFMLLLPKKQSQGLLLQQISGWAQPIDKWCKVSRSSSVFCFAQLHYQLSVVSGFVIIRLLQKP